MKRLLEARDAAEFQRLLPTIEMKVPSRAGGRTHDHVEIYSVVRLLASLADFPLTFPLELWKRERPDFEIRGSDRSIGIEHIEAITSNVAHEAALRAKGAGPSLHLIGKARLHEPDKTRQELLRKIETNEPHDGWVGDEMEREWSTAMTHFILKKAEVAQKKGFSRLQSNWLLVYDNWPVVGLHTKLAMSMLLDGVPREAFAVYDCIFILHEPQLLEMRAGSLCMHAVPAL